MDDGKTNLSIVQCIADRPNDPVTQVLVIRLVVL